MTTPNADDDMSQPQAGEWIYPSRQPFFAHRYTRLLFKSCAAQAIGHHAVLLLIHIVHTEDAARYRSAVMFWNSQLVETLGLSSDRALRIARERCEVAGLLKYIRGTNRQVGRYWVTIPAEWEILDDSPIEPFTRSNQGANTGANDHIQTAIEPDAAPDSRSVKRRNCALPSLPSPEHVPKPTIPKTHDGMQHASFRVSAANRSEGNGIRFGNILPEHVQRIVRERDGPLFESYFADAVQAGWAKDCEIDRLTMAGLFHQVVRIKRAKHPGRVINRSWQNRESPNLKKRLKLAQEDEDFASELFRRQAGAREPPQIQPLRSADAFSEEQFALQDKRRQEQLAKLNSLSTRKETP